MQRQEPVKSLEGQEHDHPDPCLQGFVRECEVGPFDILDLEGKLVVVCEVLDSLGYNPT